MNSKARLRFKSAVLSLILQLGVDRMKILSILMPSSDVLQILLDELAQRDLQVMRSFDLQSAREFLKDPEDCPCAYHGTELCTCQYVILLISKKDRPPATLVVHGHDDWTHISLAPQDDNSIAYADTTMHIRSALSALEQAVIHNALN
jgi:hypothetical protein